MSAFAWNKSLACSPEAFTLNLCKSQLMEALKSKTKRMTYELSSEFQVKLEKADMGARLVAAMTQHVTETAMTFVSGALSSIQPARTNYKMVNVSVPLHTTKDTGLFIL